MSNTMTAQPTISREPEERPDPVNGMLDLVEQAMRTVIEHGGEAALRARCARLLPAPADTRRTFCRSGASADAAARRPAVAGRCASENIDRAIGLHNAAQLLDETASRARTPAARGRAQACRDAVLAEIDQLKTGDPT